MGEIALMAVAARSSILVRLTTVLLLRSFCVLADTSSDDVIRRVQNRYNKAQSLSVDFIEHYSVQGHSRPAEAGVLTLRKPGKMRWDYKKPPGKLFISDGKDVFLYTAEDNRVEKVPLKDTEDMRAPLAFLLGRLDMKKEFRDFRTHSAGDGVWLEASAKNDRVPYEEVEMLVTEDGAVKQMKVVGRDRSVIDFTFSGEVLNPAVPNARFRFDVPPGAQVVDSVELAGQEK